MVNQKKKPRRFLPTINEDEDRDGIFVNDSFNWAETINKNGKVETVRTDWMMARTFVPNPNGYANVRHIDGNSLNDNADNLEWC